MRAAVLEVAKYFPTAIISGRSRAKVKTKSLDIYIFFVYSIYTFNPTLQFVAPFHFSYFFSID